MAFLRQTALVVTAGLTALGAVAGAEQARTVTVISFVTDKATKLQRQTGDAMADHLALRLVESGAYRVLDREWIGADAEAVARTPIASIRDAARNAGVEFIVMGRVTKFTELVRPSWPGAPMPPRVGRSQFGGIPIGPTRVRTQKIDQLRISVELISVQDGSILTTASSVSPMPAKQGSRVSPLVLLPVSPLAATVAFVSRARSSASQLDPSLERAVVTAAQSLIRSQEN